MANMKYFLIFVLTYLFASVSSFPCLTVQDVQTLNYVYNNKTAAYYKLHSKPLSHLKAETVCRDAESAELMIPSSDDDIAQVGALMKENGIRQSLWINMKYKGRHNYNSKCYVMKTDFDVAEMACHEEMPFVCKVTAADNCKALGYRYYPQTGSCYKVPPYAKTWEEASVHCREDHAHLLVLNSKKEAEIIKEYLKTIPPVSNAVNDLYFHAGFKAERPSREFRTIFGKTLEENGYVGWSQEEPNNWCEIEYCGSVVRETGMNNDISCTWKFGFICEKDIPSTMPTQESNTTVPKTKADSEKNRHMHAHATDIHDNSNRTDDENNKDKYIFISKHIFN